MPITQANRPVTVSCSLGTDKLLLRRLHGRERLGRLFEYELELASEDFAIDPAGLLGKPLGVELELPSGDGSRWFHGIVASFGQSGSDGRIATYRVRLRPWFWLLTHCSDCRIFQAKSVPDIVKQVFENLGFADYELKLNGSYAPREYCVQYRETDFDFVSRLLEKEGIFYYFRHEDGRHVLVLVDDNASLAAQPGYEEVPYFPPDQLGRRPRDHLWAWSQALSVQTSALTLNDFDFERPSAQLLAASSASGPAAGYKRYDYPGAYTQTSPGEHYARTQLEALRTRAAECRFTGDARGLSCGALFTLSGCPNDKLNIELLITSAEYRLTQDAYHSGPNAGKLDFELDIAAQDNQLPFRSEPLTPPAQVLGPQTAIVVGPAGEEIFTDKYGRVKVHFHWDRYDGQDEHSSCWIRVAQVWAGKGWGGMMIPRIGQEVVVDFLEGDPDRPLITGRVYNGEQPVPFALPANATQSGWRSRSSKGGSTANCNEIRMEDLKGSEELFIHAEKDELHEVENDQTLSVGHDRSETTGRDRTLVVGRDKSETVDRHKTVHIVGNHVERIDMNMEVSVASNLTETVGINYSETVGAAMELTVGGLLNIAVGAAMSEEVGLQKTDVVGGAHSVTIGGNRSIEVGGAVTETIDKDQTNKIGKNLTTEVGENCKETVKKDYSLQAKRIQLVADDEIALKTGSAELTLKKDGTILIKGAKITIKGSGDVVIKGSKIAEN
ncbi:MAG TPA: type VI secretion system tip protein TssI/VgrG [Plasticicumulans sp.]|nr:type VI secretion system tip protein TssI/VgrG [Plasticicumulans sp.]HNK31127.1 type VI secretion system tip protein TssI/VgrG [Plasticicumulans sp.]